MLYSLFQIAKQKFPQGTVTSNSGEAQALPSGATEQGDQKGKKGKKQKEKENTKQKKAQKKGDKSGDSAITVTTNNLIEFVGQPKFSSDRFYDATPPGNSAHMSTPPSLCSHLLPRSGDGLGLDSSGRCYTLH